MAKAAQIVGKVEFRSGDGPMMPIPEGPVDIEINPTEATLSWVDGDAPGAATLPMMEFKRYVSEGAIQLHS